jgi:uncharacterized protein (TIGR02611 family)
MSQREAPAASGILDRLRAARRRIRSTRTGRILWQSAVAALGVAVIVIGIVLLALPGPGWLIIFGGLGILATEFEWAARLLGYARRRVAGWTEWVAVQGRGTQVLVGGAGLIVLAAAFAGAWWLYAR